MNRTEKSEERSEKLEKVFNHIADLMLKADGAENQMKLAGALSDVYRMIFTEEGKNETTDETEKPGV